MRSVTKVVVVILVATVNKKEVLIMNIKVLGGGCKSCEKLYDYIAEAVKEMGIEADLEKVYDPMAIAGYGVIKTPAIVINEQVVSYGKVLKPDAVKKLLEKMC